MALLVHALPKLTRRPETDTSPAVVGTVEVAAAPLMRVVLKLTRRPETDASLNVGVTCEVVVAPGEVVVTLLVRSVLKLPRSTETDTSPVDVVSGSERLVHQTDTPPVVVVTVEVVVALPVLDSAAEP